MMVNRAICEPRQHGPRLPGGSFVVKRTAAIGASSSLPSIPAKVGSPNRQWSLRLGGGTGLHAPWQTFWYLLAVGFRLCPSAFSGATLSVTAPARREGTIETFAVTPAGLRSAG